MEEKQVRVGVSVLITKEKDGVPCVLLGKRLGKKAHGCWQVPGGGLEYGESFEECAARETREETGLVVKGQVTVLGVFNDIMPQLGKHYVDVYTLVQLPPDDAQIPQGVEVNSCAAWEWVEARKLPQPLFPSMYAFIQSPFNTRLGLALDHKREEEEASSST